MSTAVDLGTDAQPRKARPIALDRGMSATQALVVVATECLEHWRTNEALLVHSRAMPHLHQTRVGIRRLRCAVSLFGPVLERHSPVISAAHRLRELALPFGHARDLDVILAGDVLEGRHEREVAGLWQAREAAYDEVLHVLGTTRWTRASTSVDRALVGVPWQLGDDPPVAEVAAAALEKRWRRVAGQHDHVAEMTPAERHRVRIEAKKLRYGCEFFASLYPDTGDAGSALRVVTAPEEVLTGPLAYAWYVEDVQSTLGAVNDHHIADSLLRSVGARAPEVDEAALVETGVQACERLAAIPPFWR
ncbi:MAG TPA: CHAD domain-containing protein [Ornithinibacter sp.]|nr:CHAD domain-containing protein [Ornithinibacter sp.]